MATSCELSQLISSKMSIYSSKLRIYLDILSRDLLFLVQHAHIENIKTVANLSNNKDVFMCILRLLLNPVRLRSSFRMITHQHLHLLAASESTPKEGPAQLVLG